jgi:hypothetical protein
MLENELKVGSLLDNFLRSYYFENECVQNEIIARGR